MRRRVPKRGEWPVQLVPLDRFKPTSNTCACWATWWLTSYSTVSPKQVEEIFCFVSTNGSSLGGYFFRMVRYCGIHYHLIHSILQPDGSAFLYLLICHIKLTNCFPNMPKSQVVSFCTSLTLFSPLSNMAFINRGLCPLLSSTCIAQSGLHSIHLLSYAVNVQHALRTILRRQ